MAGVSWSELELDCRGHTVGTTPWAFMRRFGCLVGIAIAVGLGIVGSLGWRYSKAETSELLRLSESGEFVPEVQNLIDEELARRSDRNDVIESRRSLELAAFEIVDGAPAAEVQQKLVDGGLDPSRAASIIEDAAAEVSNARRSYINGKIASGLALFAVGVLITTFTYGGAESTGGYYLIAWGAIVSGLIQFLRGVSER